MSEIKSPNPQEMHLCETVRVHGFPNGKLAGDHGFDLTMAIPQSVGGPGGQGTNPVQLMAAGYAACLNNVAHRMARELKLPLAEGASVAITARVLPNDREGMVFAFDVALHLPGLSMEEARQLVSKMHNFNPYCNSLGENVARKVEITV